MKEGKEVSKLKITIFAHFAATGATEELRDWLINQKIKRLVYIAFPFANSVSKAIGVKVYEYGRLVKKKKSIVRFKVSCFSFLIK